MKTTSFDWHYHTPEFYQFFGAQFDVAKAKLLIHQNPREVHDYPLRIFQSVAPLRPKVDENGVETGFVGLACRVGAFANPMKTRKIKHPQMTYLDLCPLRGTSVMRLVDSLMINEAFNLESRSLTVDVTEWLVLESTNVGVYVSTSLATCEEFSLTRYLEPEAETEGAFKLPDSDSLGSVVSMLVSGVGAPNPRMNAVRIDLSPENFLQCYPVFGDEPRRLCVSREVITSIEVK